LHPVRALTAPRSRYGLQLLHPVSPVLHNPAAAGCGVQSLHPVSLVASTWPRGCCEPAAESGELVLQHGDGGLVQVVADEAQVQIPALGAAVGSLDPGRDDVRVTRRDDARGLQSVQASAHGSLG
jgi:hypothetical protein